MNLPLKQISVFAQTLCILVLFSCEENQKNAPALTKSIIWDAKENNMEGYRIPGIVVSPSGTVLAFSEERFDFGDEAPKSLVLKRSLDSGKTWSENIYIEKDNGLYWSNHSDEIDRRDFKDKKEVWTNVAPIVDFETGRIFFFYALSEGSVAGRNLQRYTKVFFKYSNDDGLTWSDRNEVTHLLNSKEDGMPNKDKNGNWITDVNGFPSDFLGRAFHMPGPGHGLQLSNGRLLLQVWSRTAIGFFEETDLIPVPQRKYGLQTIYSDDNGTTWKTGSSFGHDGLNMNESRMAQLGNGDIYINARYVSSEGGNNHRITGISKDGGTTWTGLGIDKNFPLSNPCDAGLVAVKSKKHNTSTILLYSKNESLEGRKNLVIRLSKDNGKSWPFSKTLDEGTVWYSDMTVLPDNTILILYA